MAKQVKVYTTAHNPETGQALNLAPGDEVPAWAEKVLGSHVFEEPEGGTPTEPVAGSGQSALTKAQLEAFEAQLAEAEAKGEQVAQVRTSGTPGDDAAKAAAGDKSAEGAGEVEPVDLSKLTVPKLLEVAQTKGVEGVGPDTKKADIIAAIEAKDQA